MFDKIGEFFRTFFRLIFEDFTKLFLPKKRDPIVVKEPDPEDLEPQDGADIEKDSTVVTDKDLDDFTPPQTTPPAPPTTLPDPPSESPEEPKIKTPRYLWCLDNGHGRLTAGKRSPKLSDGTQFFEYEFNRIIVKGIIKELKKHGVSYYNVVPEVNVDNFLRGRVLRANNVPSDIPKIFLSIHSNAGPGKWTTANGLETWFFHTSRKGKKLATIFQQKLVDNLGWTNRGIKSRPNNQFYVLRNTNMPAVLTESGFYNNRKEVYLLLDEKIQQKIINAHIDAILYFEENGI